MMYVGGAVALDIFGSLFMHYMTYVLRVGTSTASQAMSLMTLFQFFAIPFFTLLCIRVGNGNAYKLAIALILCALLWFSQLSAGFSHLSRLLLGGAVVMGVARGEPISFRGTSITFCRMSMRPIPACAAREFTPA